MHQPDHDRQPSSGDPPNPLAGSSIGGPNFRSSPDPKKVVLAVDPAERKKLSIMEAIASGNLTQLSFYLDGGYSPAWPDGGALQYALTLARPDIARFLLERGAPTENVCLGLHARKPVLDPALVEDLLRRGVKATAIDGTSPALETICSHAVDEERRRGLSKAERDDIARIIRALAAHNPKNSLFLVSSDLCRTHLRGHNAKEPVSSAALERCRWVVELLTELKLPVAQNVLQRFSSSPLPLCEPAPANDPILAAVAGIYQRAVNEPQSLKELATEVRSMKASGSWGQAHSDGLLSTFMSSARPDHSHVLELLKQIQARFSQEALDVSLCDASGWANEQVLAQLANLKANTEAHNNMPLVRTYYRRSSAELSPLLSMKLLVERGASPAEAMVSLPTFERASRVPLAWAYLYLMRDVLKPGSELHKRLFTEPALLPKQLLVDQQVFNCPRSKLQQKDIFKFLSHCAATALLLSSHGEGDLVHSFNAARFFLKFVRDEIDQMQATKQRIGHAEQRASKAFRACLDLMNELSLALVDSIVLPALVQSLGSRTAQLRPRELAYIRDQLAGGVYGWLAENLSLHDLNTALGVWEAKGDRFPHPNRIDGSWYPFIPDTELAPGVIVTALTTSAALRDEGHAMENCLKRGFYAPSCLLGTAHILAIRKNGESVINFTIKEQGGQDGGVGDAGRWYISHYEGKANEKNPAPELMNYLETFRTLLASGGLEIWEGAFGQTKESRAEFDKALALPIERALGLRLTAPAALAREFFSDTIGLPKSTLFDSASIPEPFRRYLGQLDGTKPYSAGKLPVVNEPL